MFTQRNIGMFRAGMSDQAIAMELYVHHSHKKSLEQKTEKNNLYDLSGLIRIKLFTYFVDGLMVMSPFAPKCTLSASNVLHSHFRERITCSEAGCSEASTGVLFVESPSQGPPFILF